MIRYSLKYLRQFKRFKHYSFLVGLLLVGCNDNDSDPSKMTSGEALYNYYCKSCHAKETGPGASMEKQQGKATEPYKIILMIKYGYDKEKHGMFEFNQLSEAQADAVARYTFLLQRAQRSQ